MQVRPALRSDLPAILKLYNAIADTTWEYTEEPHTLEERTQWFDERTRNGWPVLTAVVNDEVIGVATYGEFRDNRRWPGYRFTVEHTIHVASSHHRRGVGRALVEGLIRCGQKAGIRVMIAGIDSTNQNSIAFHANLGFVETAHMPGVGEKWGRRLDLVLMQYEVVSARS
jgi:L-amino acid N-acyltransferase YncA